MSMPNIALKDLIAACIALDRATRAFDSSGHGDLGTVCMKARHAIMADIGDMEIFIDRQEEESK